MKKVTPILKIAEIIVLALIFGIIALSKMDIDDGMLRVALIPASLSVAGLYILSLFRLSQSGVERGESAHIITRRKFALISLAMVDLGIMYTFRHYLGGRIMLTAGNITLAVVLAMLALSKEAKPKPRESLTFSKPELAPRVITGLALGMAIWMYGYRIEPYKAKTELVEALTGSELINIPISQDDARMIAAWYDVSRGFSKEKVLEAYNIKASDFDSNAEALAFGGKANVPQMREIRISGQYFRGDNGKCPSINEIVEPGDTAYVCSLRPVVYQLLRYDPMLQYTMDLENIASHTADKDFKDFVEKEFSSEKYLLDMLPEIY